MKRIILLSTVMNVLCLTKALKASDNREPDAFQHTIPFLGDTRMDNLLWAHLEESDLTPAESSLKTIEFLMSMMKVSDKIERENLFDRAKEIWASLTDKDRTDYILNPNQTATATSMIEGLVKETGMGLSYVVKGFSFYGQLKGYAYAKMVTSLDLRKAKYFDLYAGKEFFDFLFSKLTNLRSLNLSSLRIREKGAIALAEILKNNSTLTTLDLSSNYIKDEGADAFGEVLKVNKILSNLNLEHNEIGNDGATALAEALAKNESLAKLTLSINRFDDRGATALAEALTKNNSLIALDLERNEIGNDGATALAEALTKNNSLIGLNLRCQTIGDPEARFFVKALDGNKTLTTLCFRPDNLSIEIKNQLTTKFPMVDLKFETLGWKRIGLPFLERS